VQWALDIELATVVFPEFAMKVGAVGLGLADGSLALVVDLVKAGEGASTGRQVLSRLPRALRDTGGWLEDSMELGGRCAGFFFSSPSSGFDGIGEPTDHKSVVNLSLAVSEQTHELFRPNTWIRGLKNVLLQLPLKLHGEPPGLVGLLVCGFYLLGCLLWLFGVLVQGFFSFLCAVVQSLE